MSAIDLANNVPLDAQRAMTLSSMVEKAKAYELAPKDIDEAQDFIRLLASALDHVTRFSLDLIGEVQKESQP